MPDDSTREALLVLRAQTGDLDAANELFTRVGPPLERHVRRITGDPTLAADALQDVLVIAHRKLRWLRDPAHVRPWLYRIATREALRAVQRRGPIAAITADGHEPLDTAVEPADEAVLRAEVRDAIAHVSPAARALLSLHYLEGLTLPEAAAVLDVPVGTAKSRLAAGLAQLRLYLRVAPREMPS